MRDDRDNDEGLNYDRAHDCNRVQAEAFLKQHGHASDEATARKRAEGSGAGMVG